MRVIDAQIHVYEANGPSRPWSGRGHGPAQALPTDALKMMDSAGVDAAILVSPWSIYGFDASYALRVASDHPDRFTVVAPLDFSSPDVLENLSALAEEEALVGVRLMLIGDHVRDLVRSAAAERVFERITGSGLPLCVACPGELETAGCIARRHPDLSVVIDHLGLRTSFRPPAPHDTLDDLPLLLTLAESPNVSVKATGLPALSAAVPPWLDMHAVLRDVIDIFGPDRVMWGTDWTRTVEFLGYHDGLHYLDAFPWRDAEERAKVMGRTAAETFGIPSS